MFSITIFPLQHTKDCMRTSDGEEINYFLFLHHFSFFIFFSLFLSQFLHFVLISYSALTSICFSKLRTNEKWRVCMCTFFMLLLIQLVCLNYPLKSYHTHICTHRCVLMWVSSSDFFLFSFIALSHVCSFLCFCCLQLIAAI